MDRERLKRLVAACNPRAVLDANDTSFYVDIDHFTKPKPGEDPVTIRPRRHEWVDYIVQQLELADNTRPLLLTGLPGSGKSTELRRIAQRLQAPDGMCLLPVHVDAELVIDIDQEIHW